MAPPALYDLNNNDDLARWFHEMKGYLQTDHFLESGTDRPGRLYAHEAFLQLPQYIANLKAEVEKLRDVSMAADNYCEAPDNDTLWNLKKSLIKLAIARLKRAGIWKT